MLLEHRRERVAGGGVAERALRERECVEPAARGSRRDVEQRAGQPFGIDVAVARGPLAKDARP